MVRNTTDLTLLRPRPDPVKKRDLERRVTQLELDLEMAVRAIRVLQAASYYPTTTPGSPWQYGPIWVSY